MKTLNDLAVFGGSPLFAEKLHVGRPNIGDRPSLMKRINNILDTRWLTNYGPYVQELENKIALRHEVKHCIAMCNATVALEIAIRAAGLKGEVIVPSMTFVATAHALQWQEIKPVFCDIDPATHNLDPNRVAELITPQTSGIIGVHLWGRPCDVDALGAIAKRHNLRLLYDAAHAFCCSYRGSMIGKFGDAEILSFHATKFFNTLEGGAVLTNNDELAAKIRLMQNFGFQGYDRVVYVGTNGKMNEISAAIGLSSLDSLESFVEVNYQNYKLYKNELQDVPGVRQVLYNESEHCNFQYIVLEIDEEQTQIPRDFLAGILWKEGVIARRYFYPGCHRMEPYRTLYPESGKRLPATERLAGRLLSLPTGTAVGPAEISGICSIIKLVLAEAPETLSRLKSHPGIFDAFLGKNPIVT